MSPFCASTAVAESLNEEELAQDDLFPDLTRIREVSGIIACKIIRTAQKLVSIASHCQAIVAECATEH